MLDKFKSPSLKDKIRDKAEIKEENKEEKLKAKVGKTKTKKDE